MTATITAEEIAKRCGDQQESMRRDAQRIKQREAEKPSRIAEIKRSLELLHEPGSVFEIRVLGIPSRGKVYNASGYFDDFAKAAEWAYKYDQNGAAGVYYTLNPAIPALLSRAANRIIDYPKHSTADAEISRRRWLPIDIDPRRPSGIAADASERQTALDLAGEVEDVLRSRGWPHPLTVDSGNGRYAIYRVDAPNDAETAELFKRFYAGLNTLLSPFDPGKPHSTIDTTVYNAARILRVGGTTNRKGDPTADRAHRRVVYSDPIAECPVSVVPLELIRAVAKLADSKQEVPTKTAPNNRNGKPSASGSLTYRRLDVARYLGDRQVEYNTKPVDGGTAYLVQCPFDPNHGGNGEAALMQSSSGLLTYECKHNSCSGRQWHHYRDAIGAPDPGHYDGGPVTGQPNLPKNQQTPKAGGAGDAGPQEGESAEPAEKPRFSILIDCPALLAMDLHPRFLIRGVMVASQHTVIGGRSKTLKTSAGAVDMAVSLGSGTPYLGHWPAERCRVGLWSGESGAVTIRETAQRIAAAKGVELADCSVLWSFALPKLSRADHLQTLADAIVEHSIDVAIIDPLYLSLLTPETAGVASNIYGMGSLLEPVGEIAQQTGATVVVLHHFRKTGQPDEAEPAALEELAQSGVAEWARQWILLARRSPYAADGRHELWLRCGGSAGHGGLYAVDIDEGIIDPDTFSGRHWDVAVRSVADARSEARKAADNRRVRVLEQREEDDRRKMLESIRRCPEGETQKELSKLCAISNERGAAAIRSLLGEQRIRAIEIKKHTRMEKGYVATEK